MRTTLHKHFYETLDGMSIDDIIELVRGWDGALTVTPEPGDGTPEMAWGDTFFCYAPDGTMPAATQPFATIVTKNYPDDETSRLDRPGMSRLNIAAPRDEARRWAGEAPTSEAGDTSTADRVFVHPVYGSMGWLAVVNPGPRTADTTRSLLPGVRGGPCPLRQTPPDLRTGGIVVASHGPDAAVPRPQRSRGGSLARRALGRRGHELNH